MKGQALKTYLNLNNNIWDRLSLRTAAKCTVLKGEWHWWWRTLRILMKVKLNIYKAVVMSLMTYDSETWSLNAESMTKINGANAWCLSRITGKTVYQKTSVCTQTFNIIKALSRRRFKWLGHILRMSDERLVQKAVKVQSEKGECYWMCHPPTHSTNYGS